MTINSKAAMRATILLIALLIVVSFIFISARPSIEQRFYRYEADFQAAATAILGGKTKRVTKRWLDAQGASESRAFVTFHVGKDYRADFYDPQIVYIPSGDYRVAPQCSFDGRLIKKLKKQWYICKESPF